MRCLARRHAPLLRGAGAARQAEVLGVTEAELDQIHDRAIGHLKGGSKGRGRTLRSASLPGLAKSEASPGHDHSLAGGTSDRNDPRNQAVSAWLRRPERLIRDSNLCRLADRRLGQVDRGRRIVALQRGRRLVTAHGVDPGARQATTALLSRLATGLMLTVDAPAFDGGRGRRGSRQADDAASRRD